MQVWSLCLYERTRFHSRKLPRIHSLLYDSLSHSGHDQTTFDGRKMDEGSSMGPKLPARKAPGREKQVDRASQLSTEGPRVATAQATRKVGTAADGAWTKYSVGLSSPGSANKKKRTRSAGLLRLHSLNKVERMSASVATSQRLRMMSVLLVSLLLCLFKDGTHTQLATDRDIRASYERAVASCSQIVQRFDVGTLTQCLSRSHKYGVQKIQRFAFEYIPPGLLLHLLNNKPMLFVFAVSLGVILSVFLVSYMHPSILEKHVDGGDDSSIQQNDFSLLSKMVKLLPPHVAKVLKSVNLFKTLINTLFLDAGYYIVISVSYQLLPLAWS